MLSPETPTHSLGKPVIIQNRHSRRRLYAQVESDGSWGFGATRGWEGSQDQNWMLEDVGDAEFLPKSSLPPFSIGSHRPRGAPNSSVRIVNCASQRALYAQEGLNGHMGVGAHTEYRACLDQVWQLQPRPDGGYRIINVASGRALYAQELAALDQALPGGDTRGLGAHTSWADSPDQTWDLVDPIEMVGREDTSNFVLIDSTDAME